MSSHPATNPRDAVPSNGHVRSVEQDSAIGTSVWLNLEAVAKATGKAVSDVEPL